MSTVTTRVLQTGAEAKKNILFGIAKGKNAEA